MLDPRIAHQVGREIRALVPRLLPEDLRGVQRDFAIHIDRLNRSGTGPETWQEAWNSFTVSGVVEVRPDRCRACHGRGLTHRNVSRNLSRTGHPYMCGECQGGTRRGGQPERLRALAAKIPAPAPTDVAATDREDA